MLLARLFMRSRLPKHLVDAVEAIRLAREFSRGLSFDGYASNVLVRSAIERQLEILGEPCLRMAQADPDIRQRVPEVGLAIGLRNKIIHGYDRVENAVVYDTLTQDLPLLGDRLAQELERQPPP